MNLEAGSLPEHKELKVIRGPMKDMEGMQERFETWNIAIFQQDTRQQRYLKVQLQKTPLS